MQTIEVHVSSAASMTEFHRDRSDTITWAYPSNTRD